MLRMIVIPREILCFPRYGVSVSVSDLWRGMASRKSHVSELKNWMPMHSKNKKKPSVGVELRAGGDPHRSEKPG